MLFFWLIPLILLVSIAFIIIYNILIRQPPPGQTRQPHFPRLRKRKT